MANILIRVLLFGTYFAVTSGACDRDTGPSGGYECVAFLEYNNVHQWATCLTDTYIQAKSQSWGAFHQCADRSRTYCYYQCMCESYNECDGPEVNDECACDPNNPQIATTASPRPTLPPWCFSPDGNTCTWYRECLEERYPCEGTDAAYAITYAEKFCYLYSNHYGSFSIGGQQWIDAVRKCLQVALVPILRPWKDVSCSVIKDMAIASHSHCYVNPNQHLTFVSFCFLSIQDKWRVFWTIKGAFIDSFVETMKGLWDTLLRCGDIVLHNSMVMIRIFVKNQESMEDDSNKFAGKAVDQIASKENWKDKGLTWFGYGGATNTDNDQMRKKRRATTPESDFRINIILASKGEFDLNAPSGTKTNATEIVLSFAESVRNGLIRLTVDGARVDVLSMVACFDTECDFTFIDVVAPDNAGTTPKMSGCLIFVIGVLNLFYTTF